MSRTLQPFPHLHDKLIDVLDPRARDELAKGGVADQRAQLEFKRLLDELAEAQAEDFSAVRNAYVTTKEELQNALVRVDSSVRPLEAKFDYQAQTESYNGLYEEAMERIQEYVVTATSTLRQASLDLLKIEKIQGVPKDSDELFERARCLRESASTSLATMVRWISPDLVRHRGPALEEWIQASSALAGSLHDLAEVVRRLWVTDNSRTAEEERLLQEFQGRSGVDLTDLLVAFLASSEDATFEDVMRVILSLYKKHVLGVSVQRVFSQADARPPSAETHDAIS
jgi:hypothetical protein